MTAEPFFLTPGEISLAISSLALLGVIITALMSGHQHRATQRRLDHEFQVAQKRLDDQEANSRIQQMVALVTHPSERNQRIGQNMLDNLDWTAVPASSQSFLKALVSAVTDPVIRSAQEAEGEVDFVLPSRDDGRQTGEVLGEPT